MGSESIVIGLAVLAWLLWRQLQVRELRHDRGYLLPLGICAIGVLQIVDYDREHRLAGAALALLALSIVVAAIFSVIRATTVRVWLHDGRLLRQGTALTIVLWLVAIAIHLGGDHLIAPPRRRPPRQRLPPALPRRQPGRPAIRPRRAGPAPADRRRVAGRPCAGGRRRQLRDLRRPAPGARRDAAALDVDGPKTPDIEGFSAHQHRGARRCVTNVSHLWTSWRKPHVRRAEELAQRPNALPQPSGCVS